MDRPRTHRKLMLLVPTLAMRASDIASGRTLPSDLGGGSLTDKWMDGHSYETVFEFRRRA